MGDYLTCAADMGDPLADLKRAYHENRVADAGRILVENKHAPWWENLMVYTCAMRNKKDAVAEAFWQRALGAINGREAAYAAAAELMQATGPPDAGALRGLDLPAAEKAVLCCALAARHPERSAELRALSERYNFDPRYPWLFLKRWNRPVRH
jgi:hypothetical protein